MIYSRRTGKNNIFLKVTALGGGNLINLI